ncbi:hypothetical protein RADP37_04252 [Roseomonas mucosa]|uniref:Uncharacterized protein n=1 Tax=Roseomonas mucosa TaxID=207340 RepID=A0A4Y1MXE2_9PROT|nr:hypothetical protein RADP37_04252 [Roseomonas mucosa]
MLHHPRRAIGIKSTQHRAFHSIAYPCALSRGIAPGIPSGK